MKILGGRRWKRRWWRRCSTSGRSVAQRGGGGGCGGARKHVREARGGRWPWQRRAMATAALGCARGRENQGGGRARGSESGAGQRVATFRTSRRRGGGQAGRCRGGTAVRTRRPHAPGLLAGGGGRLALASRLGRPAGPHSARPQVSTGRHFFLNFVF